jgi:ABC-2 type transport system ATP-binding protein
VALINKPELLFLDEPSTGLDPQARHDLWDIIKQVKELGNTIILTTHYMEEAQYLCDEIAIMDYGKIIALGSPEALIKKYWTGMTIVLPKKNFPPPIDQFPSEWSGNGNNIEIKTEDVNASLDDLLAKKVDLAGMLVRTPNLENVFLNLTGRKLRD